MDDQAAGISLTVCLSSLFGVNYSEPVFTLGHGTAVSGETFQDEQVIARL